MPEALNWNIPLPPLKIEDKLGLVLVPPQIIKFALLISITLQASTLISLLPIYTVSPG